MGMRGALLTPAAALAWIAVVSSPASAYSADEAGLTSRVQSARSTRHLRSLRISQDLSRVAHRHSVAMARRGSIFHNAQLAAQVRGWRLLGENVALGAGVDPVHDAFMRSPTHRGNILDPDFTSLGIGVVRRGRILFVTQIFATFGATATATGESGVASSNALKARPLPPGAAPASPSSKPTGSRRSTAGMAKQSAKAAPRAQAPAACRAGFVAATRVGPRRAPRPHGAIGSFGSWVAEESVLDGSLDAGNAVFAESPPRRVTAPCLARLARRATIRPREPP